MGMYTEICLNINLKKNTPANVVEIIKYMLNELDESPELPAHTLFQTARWQGMLRSGSYYFDGATTSKFYKDSISDEFVLSVRSNLKNYDDEIGEFINWITPYVETNGFWGYSRYEEADDPTLIYGPKEIVT